MSINAMSLKLQNNIKMTQEAGANVSLQSGSSAKPSLFDRMVESVQEVANDGHRVEALSETSNDATELALAMDQFLVELSALKGLVDETKKAIDRVFQEARS
jgi:hypothetical protein